MAYTMYNLDRIINIKSLVSAFQVIYDETFNFKGEMHNFWEIVYVLDGKIGVAADSRIYELTKNQIIFHKPMEFHRLWSEGGTKPHLIIMSFDADGIGMKRFENGIFQMDFEGAQMIKDIITYVHTAFEPWGTTLLKARSTKDEMALQLIATSLEYFLLTVFKKSISKEGINTQSAKNYRRIIEVLDSHVDKNLSLDEIAAVCNMSVSNLKKTFKKYSDEGVITYFNKMKIRKSIDLLKQDLSIGEISEMLSFSSPNYFSTVFKKETGQPPINYKKSEQRLL